MFESLVAEAGLAGVIEFVRLFFAEKRGKKKSRTVLDARRSNTFFDDPPPTALCGGTSLGGIEFAPSSDLWGAEADIKA